MINNGYVKSDKMTEMVFNGFFAAMLIVLLTSILIIIAYALVVIEALIES